MQGSVIQRFRRYTDRKRKNLGLLLLSQYFYKCPLRQVELLAYEYQYQERSVLARGELLLLKRCNYLFDVPQEERVHVIRFQ